MKILCPSGAALFGHFCYYTQLSCINFNFKNSCSQIKISKKELEIIIKIFFK